MNTATINHRLDALSREIARLDAALIDLQRDAGDIVGDEVACELIGAAAAEARATLERKLREYYLVSEFARRVPVRSAA
jgi:hypothetical protein